VFPNAEDGFAEPVLREAGKVAIPMNGAQSLFKALVDAGVTTCFANPGTSEMQLVYEMGLSDAVRPILCLQEDVVTGAADGYGRMKGAPRLSEFHLRPAVQLGLDPPH
jgi:acetolactate synthase I/II/III large subunit